MRLCPRGALYSFLHEGPKKNSFWFGGHTWHCTPGSGLGDHSQWCSGDHSAVLCQELILSLLHLRQMPYLPAITPAFEPCTGSGEP